MAGGGSRFQRVGFSLPKYMLSARGRTLFSWSMESLKHFSNYEFIFVTLRAHQSKNFIGKEAAQIGISRFSVLEIDTVTSGQAETVLGAVSQLGADDPILIYNIDTYVEADYVRPEMIRGDGWVPCFSCIGDHFSFVQFDESERVGAVAEKKRISEYGTVGLYYFSRFSLFCAAMRTCSFSGLKEKFVAPLYAELLAQELPVYTTIIPSTAVHVLGTPEEVMAFDPAFSLPKSQ